MAQGSSVAEGVGTSKPWWAEEGAAIAIAVGLGLRCCNVLQGFGASGVGHGKATGDG